MTKKRGKSAARAASRAPAPDRPPGKVPAPRRKRMTAGEREADLDSAAQITESDLDRAIAQFDQDAPAELRGLLG